MQVCASRTEHRQAEQREEQPGRSTPRVVPRHSIQKNDPGHRAFNSIVEILILVRQTTTASAFWC